MRKPKPLLTRAHFQSWQAVPAVAITLGLGYLVVRIFAAGPAASFLLPSATLTTGASVQANASAIGGSMVVFGTVPTPTPTPTSTPTPTATPTPTPHLTTVKIWPVGDSITEGQLAENKNGYRLDLWNALTALGYSIDYVGTSNYGLDPLPDKDTDGAGGTCIKSPVCFTANYDDLRYDLTQHHLAALNPDIVIMNGGGNDFCCGNSQDPVRVEGYMQQWIDLIWSTEPSAYIIVLGLTGNYHPEYDSWIQTYAATLKSQGKHIDYVYIEDVTTNDTVHPDNPGYQTITDRMVPEIKPFMQALTGH